MLPQLLFPPRTERSTPPRREGIQRCEMRCDAYPQASQASTIARAGSPHYHWLVSSPHCTGSSLVLGNSIATRCVQSHTHSCTSLFHITSSLSTLTFLRIVNRSFGYGSNGMSLQKSSLLTAVQLDMSQEAGEMRRMQASLWAMPQE